MKKQSPGVYMDIYRGIIYKVAKIGGHWHWQIGTSRSKNFDKKSEAKSDCHSWIDDWYKLKNKPMLLTSEEFNSPSNQNRDRAILGYLPVTEE